MSFLVMDHVMERQDDKALRRLERERGSRQLFAWQGLRLELPPRWNPVKLEGDFEKGYALFADLHRARLGVRWHRPRMKRRWLFGRPREFDAVGWSRHAMREEVGMLASEEAVQAAPLEGDWAGALLYVEPDPPGRDVWLGYSRVSQRGVQLIHHAHRRERILAQSLLPTLVDQPQDREQEWSVFELSCRVPAGLRLERYLLNAGDLTLVFAGQKRNLLVRQVAVAQLALKRQPLEKWLAQQTYIRRRHYRPASEPVPAEVEADGRRLVGVKAWQWRRRRFGWMRWLPERFWTYALHDESRDRLVIMQGTNEAMVQEVTATVGWVVT